MIDNDKLKHKIQESITNLSNMGVIPADEVQLNLDVIYNSILGEVCSIVPMESPRQIVSYLKLIYDSENKSKVELSGNIEKDVYKLNLMDGVGAVPLNEFGYPTDDVSCTMIFNEDNEFVAPFKNIMPGTIKIGDDIFDNSLGSLMKADTKVGNVNYITGLISFDETPSETQLNYKFDIYNLECSRNFVKFVKQYLEVFANMFQLDIDSAKCLQDFKSLRLQDNIDNLLPQVLIQKIDEYVLTKYFKQAEQSIVGTWSAVAVWDTVTRVPVSMLYDDLGTFISQKASEYTEKHGVVPNVILCNPKSYGILSSSKKFLANNEDTTAGTPKFVGYYNNFKVILVNVLDTTADIVLTYKGTSEAQAAGIFTPYVPITLRTVDGMEGGGMISTTNAYSLAGFAMVNPDLVEGITITD